MNLQYYNITIFYITNHKPSIKFYVIHYPVLKPSNQKIDCLYFTLVLDKIFI